MDATQLLLSRLPSFRKVKDNKFVARCPAHEDRSPSLAISRGDKGALLHCFAGCSVPDILEALGLEAGQLFDDFDKHGHARSAPVKAPFDARQALSSIADELTLSSLLLRKFLTEGTVTNGDLQTLIGCQHEIDEVRKQL